MKSKTYKGVRDFSVVATLKGDTVFVKIKLSKWEIDISPVKIPVSEWTERRSGNPNYDKWEYLDSRYNKNADPHTARVLDQVRMAVDEVTNDAVVQEKSGKPNPPGFRVFKLAPSPTPDGEHMSLGALYEMLRKSGFPLTASGEKFMLSGKTFYSMEKGTLIVCLERELSRDVILAVATLEPQWAVFLEQGFAGSDELRAHAAQLFKERGVTFLTV